MFKSDGTQIRDPVAYVAKLGKHGVEYKGDLVDSEGQLIEDPVTFVKTLGLPPGGQPIPRRSPPGLANASISMDFEDQPVLFKIDGTPIRDPAAYVANLGSNGLYKDDLFDVDGQLIKDPVMFVASLSLTPKAEKQKVIPAPESGLDPQGMYKTDGTQIRDPVAYVARLGKDWEYKGDLVDAEGETIKDPASWVATKGIQPQPEANRSHAAVSTPPPPRGTFFGSDPQLYKADGTPIRDPVAYVAGMQSRPGGNQGGIFNSKGQEIRDPAAYIAHMQMRRTTKVALPARASVGQASPGLGIASASTPLPGFAAAVVAAGGTAELFKADGTPVRNPHAYVLAMDKNGGGYRGGLFNKKGEEIRDPAAYVSRMGGVGAGAGDKVSVSRGLAPVLQALSALAGAANPNSALHSVMPNQIKSAAAMSGTLLFQADGTPIRDPAGFLQALEKKPGGYQGGLFNHKGQEIRDPAAYIKNMKVHDYGKVAASAPKAAQRAAPY